MNLLDILSTSPHYFCRKCIARIQILILGFKGLSLTRTFQPLILRLKTKTSTSFTLKRKANSGSKVNTEGFKKNGCNDLKKKKYWNSNVKNKTCECFKMILNLLNVKTLTAAFEILLSSLCRAGFGAKTNSTRKQHLHFIVHFTF